MSVVLKLFFIKSPLLTVSILKFQFLLVYDMNDMNGNWTKISKNTLILNHMTLRGKLRLSQKGKITPLYEPLMEYVTVNIPVILFSNQRIILPT